MPAPIVFVHANSEFLSAGATALRAVGYDVVVFPEPLVALSALESPRRIEVLVTGVQFPDGRSNGVALALMARRHRPSAKAIFLLAVVSRAVGARHS